MNLKIKISELSILAILISQPLFAQMNCKEYFEESSQTNSLALFTSGLDLSLPTKIVAQELAESTQKKLTETLQMIRPYLSDHVENRYFVTQYVAHRIANTVEAVNSITHSQGLVDIQTTASSLLSRHVHNLQDNINLITNSVENRGWFSWWKSQPQVDSYALSAIQSKNQIPSLKEKVEKEISLYTQKITNIRNAEYFLLAEIHYLDEILKFISGFQQTDLHLSEIQSNLMNKIISMRQQQVLLRSLIVNYDIIVSLGQKELASAELVIDLGYAASYIQHKSLFDAAMVQIDVNQNLGRSEIQLRELIQMSQGKALLSSLSNFIQKSQSISSLDAILILENIPLGEDWGWRNEPENLNNLTAQIEMKKRKIASYSVSDFESMDSHMAIGTLLLIKGKVTSQQKLTLKMRTMRIFKKSVEYKRFTIKYKTDYEELVNSILTEL